MFFIQMKKHVFMFFILECFYVKVLHYYPANVELHYIMSIEMWSMFTIIFG